MAKARRDASNRGTCVYLGASQVRFIWACGCKRVETVQTGKGRRATPIHPDMVKRLAGYWRRSGVTLPECKKHPEFYDRRSQVSRLNAENPQPGEVNAAPR